MTTPTKDPAEIESFCCELALRAGHLVADTREEALKKIDYKTPRDLVTSADLAAEQLIIEEIKKHFPEDVILAEETSPNIDRATLLDTDSWIIDPIDGTMNYAFSQHHTNVSIAYASNGEVLAGAVFGPFYDELFSASKGNGAEWRRRQRRPHPLRARFLGFHRLLG